MTAGVVFVLHCSSFKFATLSSQFGTQAAEILPGTDRVEHGPDADATLEAVHPLPPARRPLLPGFVLVPDSQEENKEETPESRSVGRPSHTPQGEASSRGPPPPADLTEF